MALLFAPSAAAQSSTPTACFSVSPSSPTPGQQVTFNGSCSSSNTDYWFWDLDNDGQYDDRDGTTATRTFSTAGNYTVRLLAVNRSGDNYYWDTETRTVTVNRLPTANFSFSPVAPVAGQTVTFTDTSTDPDGPISSRSWDLDNDGSYDDGTGTTASRSFTSAGSYTIKVRAVDGLGGVDTETKTVNVAAPNSAPTANFGFSPAAPTTGQTITFTSSSSDSDGSITKYEWDVDGDGFDDGSAATLQRSFATPGNHTVRLRVTDDDGATNTASRTVTAANRAPNANFTISDTTPSTGQTVNFNSTSSDPDGSIAKLEWDLDNDGSFDDGTASSASRSFTTAGTFTVRLRATDNSDATDTESKTITVGTRAPTANFSFSPAAPLTGQAVQFTATSTDPDGTIARHEWDLDNDGAFDDGTTATVSRAFTAPGTFTVRLRSFDNNNASAIATKTVTVANREPAVTFTADPASPTAGAPVTFTSNATDADGTIAKLEWDLDGDGAFDDGTGATATYTFPTGGSHVIGLRATDDRGAAADATQTFDVASVLPEPTTPSGGGGGFDTSIPTTPDPAPPTVNPGQDPPVVIPPATIGRLDPFPIVRIRGRAYSSGARISLLTVKAPTGAKVELRCFGKRCPLKRSAAKVKSKRSTGTVRFRKIEKMLPAGTVLRVLVTKKGVIGKYTQFRIRRGRAPQRDDKCVMPGSSRGVSCEAG